MTVDREQIQRQLEAWIAGDSPRPYPDDLVRHCLEMDARLAKVPALVEALREISFLPAPGLQGRRTWREVAVEALAAWDAEA